MELLRKTRPFTVARAPHFIPRLTLRTRAAVAVLSFILIDVADIRPFAVQENVTSGFTGERTIVPLVVKAAMVACR